MGIEKVSPLKTVNLSAAKATAPKRPQEQDGLLLVAEKQLLKLHQQLQTTLNISTLINRFQQWLTEFQPVGSMEYSHTDENILLSVGAPKHHKVNYALRLERSYLGALTITSHKRFSEQDFFAQEQGIAVLVHCLKHAIAYQSLEKVAFLDSLTGTMNRTALDDLLPREIKRAHRHNEDLSVIIIDIDHFKSINDRIGHLGGDEILRLVAKTIAETLRGSDLAFRFGGDEFLLVLPNTNIKGAYIAAEHIAAALSKTTSGAALHNTKPQLSIGVAAYQKGESDDDLIRRADSALYKAKAKGRNCIC